MTMTVPALPRPTLEIMSISEIRQTLARSEPIVLADPMLARMAFSVQKTFYPLGFPLELSTNSEEILELANETWGGFCKLFDTQPMQVDAGVTEGPSTECPPSPTSRMRRHLCSIIADGENFAVSDLLHSVSYIWTTRGALAYPNYVKYFLLESCALCHIASRYCTPVHAACVALDDCGILLCGDSGAGKSTLAYACARAGWTYTTDDGSFLVNGREDKLIVGNCKLFRFRPSAEALFPELRGRQIIQRAGAGKPSIEVATTSLSDLQTSDTAHVRHVVFLNRRQGQRQELTSFPTEVARTFILQQMCSVPELMEAQKEMIERLFEQPAFELRYTDLDWAIERLTQLAGSGE